MRMSLEVAVMIDQNELTKYQENHQKYHATDSLYQNPNTQAELPYGDKTVPSLEAGNTLIRKRLEEGKPFMLGRFGETELRVMMYGLMNRFPVYNLWKQRKILHEDCMNWCDGAGFFPRRVNLMPRFANVFVEACQSVDILAVWYNLYEDYVSDTFARQAEICRFQSLNSFFEYPLEHPWTEALEGKKVLVISPFAETIRKQYQIREKLWRNPGVLPQFELQTMKAVESPRILGRSNGFKDWFDALEWLYQQTLKKDYDVAILGCGAYGFPLAAKIKESGHMAIQLCGQTQIWFGIKGKRWEEQCAEQMTQFANEYWTRPDSTEIPKNSRFVERGCYW